MVSSYGSAVLLLDLGHFFSFLILYTVGRTPQTGDQPVATPLPTHRTTQTQNKRTQTPMPWVGFEPTIPAFERVKTVHALDYAAIVMGTFYGIFLIMKVSSHLQWQVSRNVTICKIYWQQFYKGGVQPARKRRRGRVSPGRRSILCRKI
jgi:hypothetical protein